MEESKIIGAETTVLQGLPNASSSPCPWGRLGKPVCAVPCSLENIMSEELVEQIQAENNQIIERLCNSSVDTPATLSLATGEDLKDVSGVDTSNDLLIARMLQLELDREHDQLLKLEEQKFNGSNKVTIAYDNFRVTDPTDEVDDEEEDEDDDEDDRQKQTRIVSGVHFNKRRGISGKGNNIVTKHDATICCRNNAKRVMETFPPGFQTGDDGDFDMRLPNGVYNQLKSHSNITNKRTHRLHEKKEHSTTELAVDERTRLILYKLLNSAVLNELNGVINSGKESVVCHAYGGSIPNEVVPDECAVKIFKTTLAEFKNRCQYVCGDVRYFKDEFKKQNPRKIMRIWAEKEEKNLRRMKRFGIPCPTPVVLKKHVLVMSFIGKDRVAAPTLKDAQLSDAELQIAYEQCLEHMKTMYSKCLLVHADLSEYNLLWYEDKVYFIDVAQAIDTMHPNALQFLLRDCRNISDFFTQRGVFDVPNSYDLFNEITGLSLSGEGQEFLASMVKHEKDERQLQLGESRVDYPFDYVFDKSCAERQQEQELEQDQEEESSHGDSASEEEPE